MASIGHQGVVHRSIFVFFSVRTKKTKGIVHMNPNDFLYKRGKGDTSTFLN